MKHSIFTTRPQSWGVDIVLFLLRLSCGIAFICIGFGKIQTPTTWMGPDAHFAGFLQALAATSEFCGGMALVIGLLTRLAAFGLVCTMTVAVHTHIYSMGDPFVNTTGGSDFQLPMIYLLVTLLLCVNGPGRISIDRLIFGVGRYPVQEIK